MPKQTNAIENLDKLSDGELASLCDQIQAKRRAIREALEKEQYNLLAKTASDMANALGWEKLPKIILTPDATGKKYELSLNCAEAKTTTRRTAHDANGGKITIKKIGDTGGGIVKYRDRDGHEFNSLQDLVKALKQPDGTSEAERCWDVQHKLGNDAGIAASEIVTKYHADEVTLVFNDGTEKLVKDAVEEAKQARVTA